MQWHLPIFSVRIYVESADFTRRGAVKGTIIYRRRAYVFDSVTATQNQAACNRDGDVSCRLELSYSVESVFWFSMYLIVSVGSL